MSEDLLKKISQTAPNIPSEVAEMWLLPFAQRLDWPPDDSDDWKNRLYGQGIDFWKAAEWRKEKMDLSKVLFTRRAKSQMRHMMRVYIDDDRSSFFYEALQDDKKNFSRITGYMYQNGTFPKSPILMHSYYDENQYELVDGSRRMTALVWLQKMYAFKQSDEYNAQNQIDLTKITIPNHEQEIWLCKPDWSISTHDNRIEEYIYDMFD